MEPADSKRNRRIIKMKTIDVRLMAIRSAVKNHQGEKTEENAEQGTRDSEPKRNVPV